MTFQEQLALLSSGQFLLRSLGWADTKYRFAVEVDAQGTAQVDYVTFSPLNGEEASGEVYVPNHRLEELLENLQRRVKSVADTRNESLFNAIAAVQKAASLAGVSPEFINPITALAEQLASNALTHQQAGEVTTLDELVDVTGEEE